MQHQTHLEYLPATRTEADQYRRQDLRRVIVEALHQQPFYMANDRCLLFAVQQQGHVISREQLLVELAWLDQIAQVVRVDILNRGDRLNVANLTNEGVMVAQGLLVLPGIAAIAH